ncbi:acyl carrier protein [compost metagenome]
MEITADQIVATEEGFLEKYGFNSVDALELLLHVEKNYNIEVADEDLNANLLKSISSLASYVINQKIA